MWLLKYSRALVRIALVLVCLPLALWAVKTGHRWIPLLLFAAYLIAVQLISRKLPQAPSVPIEPQQLLRTLASGFNFIGFTIAAACLAAALSMPFGGFKGLPGWAVVLILVWWSLGALAFLWAARWLRGKAKHMP
jgi:hypothetical protein